jgi:predicted nucleotide-binding protein
MKDSIITTLEEIRNEITALKFDDSEGFYKCQNKLEALIIKRLDSDQFFLEKLKSINCCLTTVFHFDRDTFETGKTQLLNLIDLITEYLPTLEAKVIPDKKNVFIVHGHDLVMRNEVARFLSDQSLEPIILDEKPGRSKALIDKFETYAKTCGFAIILLSPDDWGGPNRCYKKQLKPRGRQNVILEMGWFMGRLGRENIVILYKNTENIEFPSDEHGVHYVPFDNQGSWVNKLITELKAANYDVSRDRIKDY